MPEEELPTLPHEIAAPEEYLPGTPLWAWIIIGVTAFALIMGLLLIIRALTKPSKKSSLVFSANLFQKANAQLVDLKEKTATMPLALFATNTSLVLRDCLSKALKDPALYETDEELAIRSESLASVPDSMRAILMKLAGAKYAPSFIDETQALEFTHEATNALREFQQSQTQPKEEPKP